MSIMRNKWLLAMMVLLAGCAGGPQSVDKGEVQQGSASAVEPDMSAAIIALKDDKPLAAEALLRGLIQRHPQAAMPWVNVGLINFRDGEWDQAQKAAERALELQPQIAAAEYLLGLIAHQQEDAPKAQQFYLSALAKNRQHAHTHYNLALLYDTYFQDIEKAAHHYRRYLELIPGEDEITQSWLHELEGQLGEAEIEEAGE